MRHKPFVPFLSMIVALLTLSGTARGEPPKAPETIPGTVDSWVLEKMAAEGRTEFILFLKEQADLGEASRLGTKKAKGTFVFNALTETAAHTQRPLIKVLKTLAVEYRPLWIANMIWVRGDAGALGILARRPEVARIHANPSVRLSLPLPATAGRVPSAPTAIEWNIGLVNAPSIWAAGFTGQDIVVGGQDTGYQWSHPALKKQYRGWNGASADHDYAWHDAIHAGNGPCGADSPVPCDDNGHGTHTMGIMVGDDGGANQIGMAPGARWIGCRNMGQGAGTPETYSECYQWLIAPSRADGTDLDPAMAPDVINNSWTCPPGEGCTDPNILLTVVDNVRAAGIVTVHAAGNSGPACQSVKDPASIYDSSLTVGATNRTDVIADFSGRGPVKSDGSLRRKPDISAPGVQIRSCLPGAGTGGYGPLNGTSMAAPHVAGLCALLFSVNPDLAGRPDLVERILARTALPLAASQGCGGDGPADVPNNVYGWGRIDAQAAYEEAITGSLRVRLSPPEANDAGARWRVDGGAWRRSGRLVSGLAPGPHTISFKRVPGWKKPAARNVTLKAGFRKAVVAAYVLP